MGTLDTEIQTLAAVRQPVMIRGESGTGKEQISGFEPRAIEMLRQYDWPNNYTQFKHILQTLATLTASTYIRSSVVAELLAKERSLRRSAPPAGHQPHDAVALFE